MDQIFQAIKGRAAVGAFGGLPMFETFLVPRDQVIVIPGRGINVHPLTMMMFRNGGRMPLWSAYTEGERELQRDRRRHGPR